MADFKISQLGTVSTKQWMATFFIINKGNSTTSRELTSLTFLVELDLAVLITDR